MPFPFLDPSGLHETQHDYLLTSRLVPRDWLLLRLRSLDAENMAVSSSSYSGQFSPTVLILTGQAAGG
jgi:hypothetical protein